MVSRTQNPFDNPEDGKPIYLVPISACYTPYGDKEKKREFGFKLTIAIVCLIDIQFKVGFEPTLVSNLKFSLSKLNLLTT